MGRGEHRLSEIGEQDDWMDGPTLASVARAGELTSVGLFAHGARKGRGCAHSKE